MSSSLPIVRDSRRRDLDATAGQTVFTFPLPVFDLADLVVRRKLATDTGWTTITTGFTLAFSAAQPGPVIATFATAPRPTAGDPAVSIRLESRRVQERVTNATRNGTVNSASLENDLDRISSVLQEVRRDVDEAGLVRSVAGRTGDITLTKADVGLANVDNTSDALKPISDATQLALAGKVDTSAIGTAAARNIGTASGNVPVLGAGGLLDPAVLPAVALTDTFTVGSQAAMLALTAQRGDIAIRTDLNKSFVLSTDSPSTLADWKELLTPTDSVLSVAGLTGAITAAALRIALNLVVGTDVQAYSARLAALAGLTLAKGDLLYFDGTNLTVIHPGAAGTFLKSQGTGNDLVYAAIPGGGDMLASNNLSDLTNPATARTNLGLGSAAQLTAGAAAGNVPVLGAGGVLDATVLPAVAITDTFAVASQAAMLALTAQRGDVAIRSDLNKSFILSTDSPSTLADWKELLTPTDAVLSVAGLTGAIAASALRTALSLVVGTDVQAYSALLAAIAALTTAANKGLYFTGANTPALFDLSAFGRSLIDDADAAAARATLSAETAGEQVGINTFSSSTAYTLVIGDKGKIVEMSNAAANTLTIPPNSSVAFPVNSRIDLVQLGAGQTTIAAGAGVTIRSSSGKLKLTGQYSGATLYKRGTDEWVLVGDLTA